MMRAKGSHGLRRTLAAVVAAVVGLMPFLISVPPASAGVFISAGPIFNGPVTVGDVARPGSFQITNDSAGDGDQLAPLTICTTAPPIPAGCGALGDTIKMTPSCGTISFSGDCPTASADPGVFAIKGKDPTTNTAVGETGTACALQTFTITPVPGSVTGQVAFVPTTPVILGPPGSVAPPPVCRIDFSYDVLKGPSKPLPGSLPNAPETGQEGQAAGEVVATGHVSGGTGSSSVVINKTAPNSFTTVATPSGFPGGAITDTATITKSTAPAAPEPTGTITFNLYGPSATPICATSIFTSTKTVTVSGSYTSAPATPPPVTPGKYYWVASYSGDASYVAATTGCGDAGEITTINKPAPTLTTVAQTPISIGQTITDTATLSGGFNPTGTISFQVFGPGDTGCATPLAFSSVKPVATVGTFTSDPFTPATAGTYRWIATYSGDGNNAMVVTSCADAAEASVVQPATPTITTLVSPAVPVGGQIFDTATLSGAFKPIGNITFTLYAPGDTLCATPIFTSIKGVTGNGNYVSDPFTTAVAGTYRWIAAYGSGDTNNVSVSTKCSDETVAVAPTTPTIVTKASPSVAVGGSVTDTATLSGGVGPTGPGGSITFRLYGPADATCAVAPVFTSAPVTVNGNGSYTSTPPFTVTTPGTYHWRAFYSGDANNVAVSTACGDANESVIVTQIVTTASGSVPAGGQIFDTATLSGGVNPTGTIIFKLYGPADTTCTGTPVFTSTKSVTANGAYQSDSFPTPAAGTYRWVASYSGDANNAAATTTCNDAGESVVVTPVTPTIVTVASTSVPAGGVITDTATLSNAVNPTGTITFRVFLSPTCAAGTALATSVRNVTANGNYTSDPFTTTAAGTYRWTASYSGDATNAAVATPCNDANENVNVPPATPGLTTQASPPVKVGGSISDTASLTGGSNPTGNIRFDLYGPNDATCTGAIIFTSTVPAPGVGTYPSGPFTPTLPGVYRFVATFTPTDTNNNKVSTLCSDPAEAVVVQPAATTLTTQVSAPVPVGGTVTDTATLSGGVAPVGGTITFNFFGPNNATCTGIPIFTSTKTVTANGNYTSDPFTVPAAGNYQVVASYSGDTRNSGAGPTACTDANEITAGTKVSPAITTTVSTGSTTINGSITDTANLTGGFNPTGTITFKLFGPGSPPVCTGAAIFTSTKTVNGTGSYVSDPFVVTAVGNYTFVATYSGDTNNNAAGPTACNDPAETAQVLPSVITIVTVASGGGAVTVGQPVSDTATVSGGVPPFGGTLTFRLFNNPTCTGLPVFTSTKTVTANGNYTSDPFVTTTAGTFHWTATYGGDINNASAGPVGCNDPAEQVQVFPLPQIGVTKVANPLTRPEPGGNFTFTVTVNNPSTTVPVKITSLFDNIYGDLSTRPGSTCGTLIGVTLAPGATSPPCTFTGPFTGRGGDSQTDTVTVTGVDSRGVVVTATAQATVTLTTVAPSISVTKVANPLSMPAPGGNFTFTVTVTNTNTVDPVTITKLVDNIYGDLATRPGSSCGLLIGTTLAPGATSPPCSFTGPFTGASGASQTDTVTVTGQDSHGTMVTATASATVILTPGVLPQIAVTKAANPLSLPQPGGTFTFTVQVSNPSPVDPVKITTLVDNIYGNLATRPGSTCGALIGITLAPGATSAPCSFTGPFMGVSGASQTDTVTVTGVDSNGNTATATAQATVTLTPPVLPQIAVTKAANPLSLPAPGGTFTFTVQVSNPSAVDPVKITSLVDNIYGDLATRAGSTCGALIGTTLAPGASSVPCTFSGPFSGVSGASQTDTVTVTGVDSNGNTVTATAKATVVLTPGATPVIAVTKAANPLSLPAPGGTFTFTVTVSNPSTTVPIKITKLVDNIYGDLATRAGSTCGALIGVTLAPGATTPPCTFTGPFSGVSGASQTDTVTVTGVDSNGTTVTATAQATVVLTPAATPVIAVTKAANPISLPAPGGTFTFVVQVSNPSTIVPVKITALVDNIYGNLATRAGSTCGALIGVTLAPGASSAPCSFTGPFTGVSGASQTDTVTVTGVDSNGNVVTATAQATVILTPGVTPVIAVTKQANPLSLPQPGGNFTFTVTVTNPSPVDPIKITSLVDNIYGNLATRPGSTCGALIGTTLAPGATSAPCSFTGPFNGVSGASQTDTVTVTGVDSNGNTATAMAQATVTLTPPVLPQIAVTKAANPLSLPAPGGTFTFTVQVSNPSAVDPVKITSLVDNIYGDLATRPGSTCGALIGTTLAPGASSVPCTFSGPFSGVSGASQTDTVTVTGVDSNGNTVTATAKATVVLTPGATPVIAVTKAANPLSLPAPGGTFTFTVTVSNPSTTVPIKITKLVDNIYGDLATRAGSTCGALIGVTLAPGTTSAPCTFTGPFTGVSGASQTDTVTVTGVDSNGTTVTATAQATVVLTPGGTPVISVTKAANPLSRQAPGGNFTFTVQVSNPSNIVPVKITKLVDNIYGNLATRPGSTCGALIGVTLAPGASSAPCTFTGPFTGVGGDRQTDIVTVTGVDTNGNTVTATAQATVSLTAPPVPMLAVTKAANPLSLPAPGGNFTFTVTVSNPSTTDPVKITSLIDNVYGDLATLPGSTCGSLIGTTLAPGATSAPCTFTGPFSGKGGDQQTDTVTATGVDTNGTMVTATAKATVTLTTGATPSIAVTKVANPLTLVAPGGNFTFTVTVTNTSSSDPVRITSVVDNVYGDLATRPGSTCGALIGVTLAPGATSAPCSFMGPFTGPGGSSQTDTVTVTGVDTHGVQVNNTARATVTITPAALTPAILAITGNESGARNLLAAGLIVASLAILSVVGRRRRYD